GEQLLLECDVYSQCPAPVSQLAVQFNKNAFGIAPAQP
ncbi:unnamed protein product, partial [Phaeothamnion confervicola]